MKRPIVHRHSRPLGLFLNGVVIFMIHDNHGSRSQICIPAHVPAFQWVLLVVLPCSHLRWAEPLRYLIHFYVICYSIPYC